MCDVKMKDALIPLFASLHQTPFSLTLSFLRRKRRKKKEEKEKEEKEKK